MYKTVEHTLFLGKNIVFVPQCPSTNDLAARLLEQSAVAEGTVVITDHQTSGRGQRGNSWVTEPRLNLTFSLILKPAFLSVAKQFFLTVVTTLAVYDFLKAKGVDGVRIKWPNDMLVADHKICGILIENQLKGNTLASSIIGIGLNILQEEFLIPSATSLKMVTGKSYNLSEEFGKLISLLESRYLLLRQGKQDELLQEYLQVLYRIHEEHSYQSRGEVFQGTIQGVDAIGKLQLATSTGIRTFDLKEIQYL